MSHVHPEDLALYALNEMAGSLKARIEDHVRQCSECLEMIVVHRQLRDLELIAVSEEAAPSKSTSGKKTTRTTWLGIAGAVGGALGLTGLKGLHTPAYASQQSNSSEGESTEEVVRSDADGASIHHHSHEDDGSMMHASSASEFERAPTGFGTPGVDGTSDFVHQTHADTCAIQCQNLILQEYGIDSSEKALMDEARARGFYHPGDGTKPEDVGKLLESHGLDVHRYVHANVFNLATELAQGHKVIVGVESGDLWHTNDTLHEIASTFGFGHADHAVIVSGIDTRDPDHVKVIVTDPGTGDIAKEYPMSEFLHAWHGSDFTIVSTATPAPEWRPEMVNFDYQAGHIPMIGAVPYELAHDLGEAAVHEPDADWHRAIDAHFVDAVAGAHGVDAHAFHATDFSGDAIHQWIAEALSHDSHEAGFLDHHREYDQSIHPADAGTHEDFSSHHPDEDPDSMDTHDAEFDPDHHT